MSAVLHITLAQINPVVGDLPFNLARIRKVRDAAPQTSDLIVFPEMSLCGYPPEDLVLKPFFLDRVAVAVHTLAAESAKHKAALLVGAPLQEDGKIYNALHLIGGGKIIATIRKHHLPNYGVFDEARIFSSAPLSEPVSFNGHKLGLMICEDMWLPDVAANLKKKGADLLIVVNADPHEITKNESAAGKGAREGPLGPGCAADLRQSGRRARAERAWYSTAPSFVLSEKGGLVDSGCAEFAEDIHHTIWNKTPSGH